jgi:hypothetical protein
VPDVAELMGLSGQAVTVNFRGRRCTVVAQLRPEGFARRPPCSREPMTDVMSLELASGSGEVPGWSRPVDLHAVIESGRDALRTVQRAFRWVSCAAWVALVPEERVTERACFEASLVGGWVIATGEPSRVVVRGEGGPVTGARRSVVHRLLDEIVAEALLTPGSFVPDRGIAPLFGTEAGSGVGVDGEGVDRARRAVTGLRVG